MNEPNHASASHKKFSEDLQAIKAKIEQLDNEVINPDGYTSERDFLNNYGKLIEQICQAFNAENLNVFFQQTEDPLLLDGVLSLRESSGALRLQFIKNPIDNFTISGYTFLESKVVNIDNLYIAEEKYQKLEPTRNKEIDRRLNKTTKQCLSSPIINPATRKIVGSLQICNTLDDKSFSELFEKGVNALAMLVNMSFHKGGIFSRIVTSTKNLGKGGFATSLAPNAIEVDSGLNDGDFVEKQESVKLPEINLQLTPEKKVSAPIKPVGTTTTSAPAKPIKVVEADENDDEEYDVDDYEDEEEEEEVDEVASATGALDFNIKSKTNAQSVNSPQQTTAQAQKQDSNSITPIPIPKGNFEHKFSYLIQKKIITPTEYIDFSTKAKRENRSLEELIRQTKKSIPIEEFGKSYSAFFKVEYMPYSPNYERPTEFIVKVKPIFFEENKWLPVTAELRPPHTILIATPDPVHAESFGSISQLYPGRRTRLLVTTEFEFNKYYKSFFSEENAVEDLVSGIASEAEATLLQEEKLEAADNSVSEDELVKLVNKIVQDAYYRRCSDIHIEPYPGNLKMRIRFRIDGELVEYIRLSSTLRARLCNRIKIMAGMNISESRIPQDGKIKMSKYLKTLDIELRVATYPVVSGNSQNYEDVVMRILASGEPLPLEKLGMLPEKEKALIEIAEKPYGIIFVCGPTGSGKTTTLHSILHHLNKDGAKIVTAEDPVEITQHGLRQMQINKQAGVTFEAAMRSFLRADPDIIMVGEMRDHETVAIGVEASLTGHLVLSTLHTNSAPEAITRLLDMGMDPLNFADAMLGILAQRLTKRLCNVCKQTYHPDSAEVNLVLGEYCKELSKTTIWKTNPDKARAMIFEQFSKRYAKDGKFTFCKPVGCEVCIEGYKGRLGLYELLIANDRLKTAIKSRARVEEMLEICLDDDMYTLKMDGIHKVFSGVTDFKQVSLVTIK